MRRLLTLTFVVGGLGCRVAPPTRPVDHPARADAPTGRLAGPPAILGATPTPTPRTP